MRNNLGSRVESPIDAVTGILVGDNLLSEIKKSMIQEDVFIKMYGSSGERIFINEIPNMNETITPCVLLAWKTESYSTFDAYFEGQLDCKLILPTQMRGDYNALRRVGALFQRFIGTRMNLFSSVLGLIELGVDSTFDYTNLAVFSGMSCPVIQVSIPYKFDMQKIIMAGGYDPSAALDADFTDADLLKYNLIFCNPETNTVIATTGDLIEQI